MLEADLDKQQGEAIPAPQAQEAGVILSSDTQRRNRLPPGQSRTKKWPVLDASGPPAIELSKWRFRMAALTGNPVNLSWEEFLLLPRVKVFADFHCVTRWWRLGNLWEGVSRRTLAQLAGGVREDCRFVLVQGYDHGWTTNLPLSDFLAEDALVAIAHGRKPLSVEHGGPARLVVPQRYAWKSAKWVAGIEFFERERAGFWERNGYHMRGDPCQEERFGYGP